MAHPQTDTPPDTRNIWAAIAAPLPAHAIEWRQDGRPVSRDGKNLARFVPYVTSQYVRERLDSVVPGEWDATLELIPAIAATADERAIYAFKARVQILGVIREDIGQGEDYKAAATDAFKRAAMRFGIASELYSSNPNWVPMDGDGKYAKPLMDPTEHYTKKYGTLPGGAAPGPKAVSSSASKPAPPRDAATEKGLDMVETGAPPAGATTTTRREEAQRAVSEAAKAGEYAGGTASPTLPDEKERGCPKCGGRMWDNRLSKRNPKAPDFKCRDRSCDGVIWPPKDGQKPKDFEPVTKKPGDDDFENFPGALTDEDDDLPF